MRSYSQRIISDSPFQLGYMMITSIKKIILTIIVSLALGIESAQAMQTVTRIFVGGAQRLPNPEIARLAIVV